MQYRKRLEKNSAKIQPVLLKHLTKNITEETKKKKIFADTQTETFSKNSSLINVNQQFLTFKHNAEKHNLNFKSGNSETYNKPFILLELTEAIQRSHHKTIAPDEIHYKFLKNQ